MNYSDINVTVNWGQWPKYGSFTSALNKQTIILYYKSSLTSHWGNLGQGHIKGFIDLWL